MSTRPPTILVVDGSDDFLRVCALQLQSFGYAVLSAGTGTAALALLDTISHCPDLIVLDTQLSDMSGAAFVEQAVKRVGRVPVLPIANRLFLSRKGDAGEGSESGPFDVTALIGHIRTLLGNRSHVTV